MSEPSSPRSRELHFNRACAKYSLQVFKILREINQDIAKRGIAAQGFHPRIKEVFLQVDTVVKEMLTFDEVTARLESKRIASGAHSRVDPYSDAHEESLVRWVRSQLSRLPEGIVTKGQRLSCKADHSKDLARMIEQDVIYRIRREYSTRRAEFQAESGIPEPLSSEPRPRRHETDVAPNLSEAEERIIGVIRSAGQRLVTKQVMAELRQVYGAASEGTTKVTLAGLVRRGLLSNRRDVRPNGYGLPEWEEHGQ